MGVATRKRYVYLISTPAAGAALATTSLTGATLSAASLGSGSADADFATVEFNIVHAFAHGIGSLFLDVEKRLIVAEGNLTHLIRLDAAVFADDADNGSGIDLVGPSHIDGKALGVGRLGSRAAVSIVGTPTLGLSIVRPGLHINVTRMAVVFEEVVEFD